MPAARRDLLDWVVDRRVDTGFAIAFLAILAVAGFGLPALGVPDWAIGVAALPALLLGIAYASLVFAAGRRRRRLWDARMLGLGFRRAPGQGPAHFRTYLLERGGRTVLAGLEAAPEPLVFIGLVDEWGEERQVSVPFRHDKALEQAVEALLAKDASPAALPAAATAVLPPPTWAVWAQRVVMLIGWAGAGALFAGLQEPDAPLAWTGATLLAGSVATSLWLRAWLKRQGGGGASSAP